MSLQKVKEDCNCVLFCADEKERAVIAEGGERPLIA